MRQRGEAEYRLATPGAMRIEELMAVPGRRATVPTVAVVGTARPPLLGCLYLVSSGLCPGPASQPSGVRDALEHGTLGRSTSTGDLHRPAMNVLIGAQRA